VKGRIAILKKVLHLDTLSSSLDTLSSSLDAISNGGFKVTDRNSAPCRRRACLPLHRQAVGRFLWI